MTLSISRGTTRRLSSFRSVHQPSSSLTSRYKSLTVTSVKSLTCTVGVSTKAATHTKAPLAALVEAQRPQSASTWV